MGDDLAGAIDHIGIAGLAHLDTRDDIADIFKVHLGFEHTDQFAGESFHGHGDNHVGFRAAHEIDRPEIGFALFGMFERRRIRRTPLPTGNRRETRQPNLLDTLINQLPRCDEPSGTPTARSVMINLFRDFPGPVLFGFPSGHTIGPAVTLPFGVACRVIADAHPRLIIEESAVE